MTIETIAFLGAIAISLVEVALVWLVRWRNVRLNRGDRAAILVGGIAFVVINVSFLDEFVTNGTPLTGALVVFWNGLAVMGAANIPQRLRRRMLRR